MNEPNPVNIALIDHVVLRVRNMGAMLTFYEKVLGSRLERVPGTAGWHSSALGVH